MSARKEWRWKKLVGVDEMNPPEKNPFDGRVMLDPAPSPDDIVGHKTFGTGRTGASGLPELRHEPLSRREAEAILAACEEERAQRAAQRHREGGGI